MQLCLSPLSSLLIAISAALTHSPLSYVSLSLDTRLRVPLLFCALPAPFLLGVSLCIFSPLSHQSSSCVFSLHQSCPPSSSTVCVSLRGSCHHEHTVNLCFSLHIIHQLFFCIPFSLYTPSCLSVFLVTSFPFLLLLSMFAGGRAYMEDRHRIHYQLGPFEGFFAVYDGHGGPCASEYMKTHFHMVVRDAIMALPQVRISYYYCH